MIWTENFTEDEAKEFFALNERILNDPDGVSNLVMLAELINKKYKQKKEAHGAGDILTQW